MGDWLKRPFMKRLQCEIDDSKRRGGMIAGWPTVLVKRHELEQSIDAVRRLQDENERLNRIIDDALADEFFDRDAFIKALDSGE